MILDVTLKEKSYFLKVHKNFFENKSIPLETFQMKNPLMLDCAYLGTFHISNESLGFDGCLKLYEEDGDYLTYKFDIYRDELRRFLVTIHLLNYYVLESMFYKKEFFTDGIWENQSLSFSLLNGGSDRCGYSISGQIYSWFKDQLFLLSDEELKKLNEIIHLQLKELYLYLYKREFSYTQVTIERDSFFIKVDMGGRWISWKRRNVFCEQEAFSSHNMDHACDQGMCFAAIVLINTWLREN